MKGRVYAPFRLNMNLNLKILTLNLNLKDLILKQPRKIKAADPEKEVVGLGIGLAGGYVRPWYRRVFVDCVAAIMALPPRDEHHHFQKRRRPFTIAPCLNLLQLTSQR
jgi:hypothetical protein